MNDLAAAKEFTTPNGGKFKLEFTGFGYQWKGQGVLHPALAGIFTTLIDAGQAAKNYLDQFKHEDKSHLQEDGTDLERLDMLTKRDELLMFASKHDIEVPKGLTRPTQIKKMLKAELENA